MAAEFQIPDDQRYPARITAWLIVAAAMTLLYWRFSGPVVPDWTSYSRLFDHEGGYLARQERDPLFVQVLRFARVVFGGNGYADFRAALFVVFGLIAARIAYAMPSYRNTALLSAIIVLAAFLLKSLVQIREGLAFLLVSLSMIGVFQQTRRARLMAAVAAVVAWQMHAAAMMFAIAWLGASIFVWIPSRVLPGSSLQRWLLGLAILFGGIGIWAVFRYSKFLEFTLQDLGADTNAQPITGIWKYFYWIFQGVIVLQLRQQLREAGVGAGKFAYGYANILGSLLIPAIYLTCAGLVFGSFYLPEITSIVGRLLFSSSQLALIIIGLRGRANSITLAIALFSIADQYRLLTPSN